MLSSHAALCQSHHTQTGDNMDWLTITPVVSKILSGRLCCKDMLIEEASVNLCSCLAEMVNDQGSFLNRSYAVDAPRAGHLVGETLPECKYLPGIAASWYFPVKAVVLEKRFEVDDGLFVYPHCVAWVKGIASGAYIAIQSGISSVPRKVLSANGCMYLR
jgi:hypothetical protein